MKLGKYQHFRNKHVYEVIGVAIHTETRQELVVYRSLYKTEDFDVGQLWVRPKEMFLEIVDNGNEMVSRFQAID